jgi:lysophospholipase L1-like esterase
VKNILCYGDSNTWGCKPIVEFGVIARHRPEDRWTSVMSNSLGADYLVIPEGLNARTTVHDDPVDGAHKNGKTYLLPCLETHVPLDLVIIMLGTNDLKNRFSLSAFDIASGLKPLLEIVASIAPKNGGIAPQTLVIAPPPVTRLSLFADMFVGAAEKSRGLAQHYENVARNLGSHFLDAGSVITSSDLDGFHLDADQQARLGEAVADIAKNILMDE